MNRLLVLATWIFLSIFLMGPAYAASDPVPLDQQNEENVQGTPTTPAAALSWQEREKARHENQRRAEALRRAQIEKELSSQPPAEGEPLPVK